MSSLSSALLTTWFPNMAKLSYSHWACRSQNVVHDRLAFVTYKACNKTGVSDDNNMYRLHVSSPIKLCFTGLQDHATHSSTKHIIIAMQQNVGTESTGHIIITPGNMIHTKLNN